jgi:NAD(P)H-dependent flavin oxidoreductase YrpB (nitropropane dioxygenase family)
VTLRTRATELLGIHHPIVMGGMGSGATSPPLVAAVSEAGGLGILGVSRYPAERIRALSREIREATERPFGLNLLLFLSDDVSVKAVLAERPRVFSTSWPWPDQDLRPVFERAHDAGALVMHQATDEEEASRAAEAGADLVVAQGTEGGGHVGTIGTLVLVPMVVRAVEPLPVLAAGGIATGAQIASALLLGADGVLMGTRFLATEEAPWPRSFKQAIVDSDGRDTLLTEIPDIAKGTVWPGAFDRARRNRLIEEWAGREHELRRHRTSVQEDMARASRDDDASRGELNFGQAAGLIDSVESCADLVPRLSQEAADLLAAAVSHRVP